MKIITVFNNHSAGNHCEKTELPGWMFLPDSSLMKSGNPFFLPDLESLFQQGVSTECRAFPSLAFRVSRLGKSIEPRFISRYISDMCLCVNFIAEDIRQSRSECGLPWTEGVSFDRSFLCGEMVKVDLDRLHDIEVSAAHKCATGEKEEVIWKMSDLKYTVEEVFSRISRMNTLKIGDILVPGVPGCGFRLNLGDSIEVKSEGLPAVEVIVK